MKTQLNKVPGRNFLTIFGSEITTIKGIAQVYTAVKYYNNLFDEHTIVLGDFNWNHIWDISPDGSLYGNLADTRDILNNNGIFSLYHKLKKEKFGKELVPTFYMYKKRNRGYHIDYIFAHKDMINNIIDFWVGKYEKWIEYSDHMPLLFKTSNQFTTIVSKVS